MHFPALRFFKGAAGIKRLAKCIYGLNVLKWEINYMDWIELVVSTTHEAAEAVGGALYSCGISCWATEDKADLEEFMHNNTELWDYVDDELLNGDETVKVKVYLPDDRQGRDTLIMVKSALEQLGLNEKELNTGSLAMSVNSVNQEDWANEWKKYFHPIEIGKKLTVCPSWEEYDNKDGRSVLYIDPGCAFGTGGHATTKLCLMLLEGMDCRNKKVLDVGCGSGILAVAALLLGADKAVGVDIDSAAVPVAAATAELNGVQEKAEFRQADLVKGITGKYDIITANIVADIVIRLTPQIPALLAPGGKYIVSGIIDERKAEVIKCLEDNGFAVLGAPDEAGWTAICACAAEQ